MKKKVIALAAGVALVGGLMFCSSGSRVAQAKESKKLLAHMVFFTLKERTPEARQKLVDACDKYLSKHPGTVYYSAGIIAEDYKRPVNDRDFDVALHVVFEDAASHDKYQEAPRHLDFINENKDTWAKVRVFDSIVKE